jgi:hypothetical protein
MGNRGRGDRVRHLSPRRLLNGDRPRNNRTRETDIADPGVAISSGSRVSRGRRYWLAKRATRFGPVTNGYRSGVVPESSDQPVPAVVAAEESVLATGPETLDSESSAHEAPQGMVPGRERRRSKIERGFMRIVATGGVIGIATVLGALLVNQDVAGWIVGLAVGLTSVILAALLWSSRQL